MRMRRMQDVVIFVDVVEDAEFVKVSRRGAFRTQQLRFRQGAQSFRIDSIRCNNNNLADADDFEI